MIDYPEYRLLYPDEAQRLLEAAAFAVVGLYDNREFEASDLAGAITTTPGCAGMLGRKLYLFAIRS